MAVIGLAFFAIIMAGCTLVQRKLIKSDFYTDPCGKRCWCSIESNSTTVLLKGTVEEQSGHTDNLFFVRTDKGFLYVADISEITPEIGRASCRETVYI